MVQKTAKKLRCVFCDAVCAAALTGVVAVAAESLDIDSWLNFSLNNPALKDIALLVASRIT